VIARGLSDTQAEARAEAEKVSMPGLMMWKAPLGKAFGRSQPAELLGRRQCRQSIDFSVE
jgi:hypothetical protein